VVEQNAAAQQDGRAPTVQGRSIAASTSLNNPLLWRETSFKGIHVAEDMGTIYRLIK